MKLCAMVRPGVKSPACSIQRRHARPSAVIPDLSGDCPAPESIERLRADRRFDVCLASTAPSASGRVSARVGKFICIGLNYSDHAAESGMAVPSEPILFMKATSAICGPNDDIVIPRGSQKTDWEVELGVVIGSRRGM